MEESQWLPGPALAERQWRQVALLARHAAGLDFWRRRFADAAFAPDDPDPRAFARIRPLRRADIQDLGTALHLAPPEGHGPVAGGSTTGSTGAPIAFLGTGITYRIWQAMTLREHAWHRRDPGLFHAFIRPGAREDHDTWGPPTDLLHATGRSSRFPSSEPVAAQWEWLARANPDYLLTLPSNLADLIAEGRRCGQRLPALRQVRTVGEVVSADLRRQVSEHWGVRIADLYSASEIGYLALECPEFEGRYHVQAEGVLLEVLREDGHPCGAGEVGEVVVTSLHNYAMPLIRYAIGDYAEVGAPCPCGRGLPVLERILGRVRNMLTLPDGGRRWPLFGLNQFPDIPIRQYRVVQKDPVHLEVHLVCERGLSESEEAAIRDTLHRRLHPDFAVAFRYPADLPRNAGGKFEDFVNECPDGRTEG